MASPIPYPRLPPSATSFLAFDEFDLDDEAASIPSPVLQLSESIDPYTSSHTPSPVPRPGFTTLRHSTSLPGFMLRNSSLSSSSTSIPIPSPSIAPSPSAGASSHSALARNSSIDRSSHSARPQSLASASTSRLSAHFIDGSGAHSFLSLNEGTTDFSAPDSTSNEEPPRALRRAVSHQLLRPHYAQAPSSRSSLSSRSTRRPFTASGLRDTFEDDEPEELSTSFGRLSAFGDGDRSTSSHFRYLNSRAGKSVVSVGASIAEERESEHEDATDDSSKFGSASTSAFSEPMMAMHSAKTTSSASTVIITPPDGAMRFAESASLHSADGKVHPPQAASNHSYTAPMFRASIRDRTASTHTANGTSSPSSSSSTVQKPQMPFTTPIIRPMTSKSRLTPSLAPPTRPGTASKQSSRSKGRGRTKSISTSEGTSTPSTPPVLLSPGSSSSYMALSPRSSVSSGMSMLARSCPKSVARPAPGLNTVDLPSSSSASAWEGPRSPGSEGTGRSSWVAVSRPRTASVGASSVSSQRRKRPMTSPGLAPSALPSRPAGRNASVGFETTPTNATVEHRAIPQAERAEGTAESVLRAFDEAVAERQSPRVRSDVATGTSAPAFRPAFRPASASSLRTSASTRDSRVSTNTASSSAASSRPGSALPAPSAPLPAIPGSPAFERTVSTSVDVPAIGILRRRGSSPPPFPAGYPTALGTSSTTLIPERGPAPNATTTGRSIWDGSVPSAIHPFAEARVEDDMMHAEEPHVLEDSASASLSASVSGPSTDPSFLTLVRSISSFVPTRNEVSSPSSKPVPVPSGNAMEVEPPKEKEKRSRMMGKLKIPKFFASSGPKSPLSPGDAASPTDGAAGRRKITPPMLTARPTTSHHRAPDVLERDIRPAVGVTEVAHLSQSGSGTADTRPELQASTSSRSNITARLRRPKSSPSSIQTPPSSPPKPKLNASVPPLTANERQSLGLGPSPADAVPVPPFSTDDRDGSMAHHFPSQGAPRRGPVRRPYKVASRSVK